MYIIPIDEVIALTLQWIKDVSSGEMIEHPPDYNRTHLVVSPIYQKDLDFTCKIVNQILKHKNSNYIVINSMGEFIPSIKKSEICNTCGHIRRRLDE